MGVTHSREHMYCVIVAEAEWSCLPIGKSFIGYRWNTPGMRFASSQLQLLRANQNAVLQVCHAKSQYPCGSWRIHYFANFAAISA